MFCEEVAFCCLSLSFFTSLITNVFIRESYFLQVLSILSFYGNLQRFDELTFK